MAVPVEVAADNDSDEADAGLEVDEDKSASTSSTSSSSSSMAAAPDVAAAKVRCLWFWNQTWTDLAGMSRSLASLLRVGVSGNLVWLNTLRRIARCWGEARFLRRSGAEDDEDEDEDEDEDDEDEWR